MIKPFLLVMSIILTNCTSELNQSPFLFAEKQSSNERSEILSLSAVDSLNLSDFDIFNASNLILEEDNLFVLNSDNSKILIFNNELSFTNSIKIPQGKGPGEVSYLRQFDVLDETILIPDSDQMKFMLYTTEGDYIKEFRTNDVMLDRSKFVDEDRVIVESMMTTDSLFYVIDLEGNHQNAFQSTAGIDNFLAFTGRITMTEDHLYFAGYSEPVIKKFDVNTGELIFSKEVVDVYNSEENYEIRMNGDFKITTYTDEAKFASIGMAVSDDFIYTSRFHNGTAGYKFIDVYSSLTGEYLKSFQPRNYQRLNGIAADDDFLYSLESDSASDIWLFKYRTQ